MGFDLSESLIGTATQTWDMWERDRLAEYRRLGPDAPHLDEFHQVVPWRVWVRTRRGRRRRRVAVATAVVLAVVSSAAAALSLLGWPL